MTQNYIGINGLVTQSYDEIVTDITTQFQAIYGSTINLEQNSPDGQLINIWAQAKKDIIDLITQYYNNLDPDTVTGIAQQVLYKLNGLTIKAYTYSYVYVNVTVTEAVTLAGLDDDIESADGTGYTVRDTNGNRWILAETATLTAAGTYLLNFRAADLGSVTVLPNNVTIMETVQKGVSGVNNPDNNYVTGNTGESSSEFRLRRNRSLATPSQGFDESVEGQMLALDNVTQCKVYDNRGSETDERGIPGHSVWIIVEGGATDDIGRIIYANVPPGIGMKGEQSVDVIKSNGNIETVYYDLPASVPLYVKADIKNFTTTTIDTDYLKEQLAQTSYLINETAETADITTTLKELLGETGTPYNVEISADGSTWVEYATPSGLDEYFVISTDNITLTVD